MRIDPKTLQEIIGIVKDPIREKPWITAQWIYRKLSKKQQQNIYLQDIQDALVEYARNNPNEIRQSSLPSKKTLDVLWGSIDRVSERDVSNITKDNVHDDFFAELPSGDGAKTCFISHSHKDVDKVVEIGHLLAKNNIYPWLAETEISQGEEINGSIKQALEGAELFLLYLSPNALSSIWTMKEFAYAPQERLLVIPENDESIFKVFQGLTFRTDDIYRTTFASKPKILRENQKADEFIQYLGEFLKDNKNLYYYGELKNENKRVSMKNGLKLSSLESYLNELKIDPTMQ